MYVWPGQEIDIGGLETEVVSARFLVGGEPIDFEQEGDRLKLREAPGRPLDARGVRGACGRARVERLRQSPR